MSRTDTRQRLLDAAIKLIASGGLQSLSHRALENAAGAARGSTTYHLGTSHQIIEAVLDRLAELDTAAMQDTLRQLALDQLAAGTVDVAAAVRGIVAGLLDDRDRVIARYTLMIEAARDETLRPTIRRWRDAFVTIPEPLLARLGAPAPAEAARDLVALMDGIIFEHLSTGRPGLEERVAATIATFIRHVTEDPAR